MTKEQNPYTARFLDFTPPNVTKEGLISKRSPLAPLNKQG
jgi:hypothetical protein